MTDTSTKIELLLSPGCAAVEAASKLVEEVLSELGLKADVSEIMVNTLEQARALKFLGSPSIRVNGIDIEPGTGHRLDYGLQ
jgi:hypothetical protein